MQWMDQELKLLSAASLERSLQDSRIDLEFPGYTVRSERTLLNLSSNNYLGLADHPAIIEAMREALLTEGVGSGASRLVTGNRTPYYRLEQALAEWQGCEAALVIGNGYMANSGVIGALVGRGDVVFSDRLNHASIVDGVVLSRAEHVRYRHNDMEHLRTLLSKYRDRRRKLIVTDAVFSMDGDKACLGELALLKQEFGAMLMVDEAHSGGIYGRRGEGLCHELGIQEQVDIHMGTFSKSFGIYGAYICGSHTLIRWLINHARPLIYSTALPPSLVSGISKALELVISDHWRRERLFEATRIFRSSLRHSGFIIGDGDSPIVPLIVGNNEAAMRYSRELETQGIAAVAIRPPTVPDGTARIRFSLSALHSDKELSAAADCIRTIGQQLEVL
ncbi:8-amino-7-oxononanoate synthase [Paenibacillus glycanilyticus]|uniref:8-amino-7-oxononanoate synthase n=1 Tax=Paenibacillus glycanilyticus TaxID=126569 RepID=UPI00203BB8C8|nr:8-amino-7-oxononanoate synthase [Paenibacillus glycanilyticus]MCM3628206.1 8-amino-7-oxononanoate synthase [Paenibacillus glycanilyticus]